MKDHVYLEPGSSEKRRHLEKIRNESRTNLAVWTVIIGACTMANSSVAIVLQQYLPF